MDYWRVKQALLLLLEQAKLRWGVDVMDVNRQRDRRSVHGIGGVAVRWYEWESEARDKTNSL